MSTATSPDSAEPEPLSDRGQRAQLEQLQAALRAHGAVVTTTPLPDEALAPKLAAERQRLAALERP